MHSQYMYSCLRDEIDPSINLSKMAQEILALERELTDLWQEYADTAAMVGMVDLNEDNETLRDILKGNVDIVAENGHTMLESFPSDVSWKEEYGAPKSIHYGRDGIIRYTLDSGETFKEND